MNSLIELKTGLVYRDRDSSRHIQRPLPALIQRRQSCDAETVGEWAHRTPRIRCRGVRVSYGAKLALHDVDLDIGCNIEVGPIAQVFADLRHPLTNDYFSGRFG